MPVFVVVHYLECHIDPLALIYLGAVFESGVRSEFGYRSEFVCLFCFCFFVCLGFFLLLLLFFAFPSYISGVHHFWVRFLRM